jgi:prepilin-type N-terminal cleavage/methylation domain-containing protein
VRERLLRDQSGFTLVEVLVAMMMMLTVMFALYSIFDMSLRVFSFGNDKVEAVENARIGLSRMEREIRAAYPNNKPAGDTTLLFSGTDSDTIVFGNDTNGNRVVGAGEVVTYDLPSGATKLKRNTEDTVEYVSGLSFGYQDRFGNPVPYTNAEIVKITLTVNKDGRTQALSTDVSLRNRNN